MEPRVGVVIPVGVGRAENLVEVIGCLNRQTVLPEVVVLACDGPEAHLGLEPKEGFQLPMSIMHLPKHEPGMEQPRNAGVRELERFDVTHVWFLDTDVIVGDDCLEALLLSVGACQNHGEDAEIIVAPYDWLPPGVREPTPDLRNDPRWGSFERYPCYEVVREDLAAGLACFSGNLLWSIEAFKRVGGFWNELHHGRCEDGELGLRAVAMGTGVTFQGEARGWHLWHRINLTLTQQRNFRDVPMINERHPWKELPDGPRLELFVVEEDGKRFNARCPCGWEGNTVEVFAHQAGCEKARG